MSERVGIIDIGSNSARMVVFQYQPHHSFTLVDEVKETVRLAHGTGKENLLQPENMERAVETLRMFGALGRSTEVPRLVVVGTSAVRDAVNQPSFLARIAEETGLTVRVLSGEEEAYYGYLGVVNSLSFNDGLLFDIGGGSMQVSLVRGRGLVRSISLPLGTIRMQERFFGSDRPDQKALKQFDAFLQQELSAVEWFRGAGEMKLIGVGGTARNLAKLDQAARSYGLDKAHGYEITLERIEALAEQLAGLSVKEREDLPGMSRERADIMLPGVLLIRALMRHSGCTSLQISGHGLREGLFYEQFLVGASPPLIGDVRAFGVQNLARRYQYHHIHTSKVRDLSLQLFDQLQSLHGYGGWERELLTAAAVLHDIGIAVSYYDYHKHGFYLILNSFLPGFSHRENLLIALLTRYHRKGGVSISNHRDVLQDDDEQRVARLSALLRMAKYLDRGKSQVVQSVRCTIREGSVQVAVRTLGDAAVEIWDAGRQTSLFRKAYGCDVNVVEEQP